MIPETTTVKQFALGWMKLKPIRPPFADSIFIIGPASSLVLFREEQFQVELFICSPYHTAPFHKHPNVESLIVYLTGDMELSRGPNEFFDLTTSQHARQDGAHSLLGKQSEGYKGEPHTMRVKGQGGAYLHFQKWTSGVRPTSVIIDWSGEVADIDHEELLCQYEKEKPE